MFSCFCCSVVCVLVVIGLASVISGGSQPMQDVDGELCIVFNGEIYNFAELRQELLQA